MPGERPVLHYQKIAKHHKATHLGTVKSDELFRPRYSRLKKKNPRFELLHSLGSNSGLSFREEVSLNWQMLIGNYITPRGHKAQDR